MWKIFLLLVILFLLRDRLALLRPYWRTVVPLMVGAVAGFWWACFLVKFGVDQEVRQCVGISSGLFRLIMAACFALMLARPGRQFLCELFPEKKEDGKPK